MWTELAGGTYNEFQNANPPVNDLPHGTPIILKIDTTSPIAPLADLFGMEWVIQKLYKDSGAIVKDVRSTGWYSVEVEMEANAVQAILLIIAIVAIIGGLAYLVHEIRMIADIMGPVFPWLMAAGIAVAGLLVYSIYQRTRD